MRIRDYIPSDCQKLADLFYETVHTVNAKDYTSRQLYAWASGKVNLEEWNTSFLEHKTLVAQIGREIVGFGDLDRAGYLDRLYVHKDFQNRGIATALCDKLERGTNANRIVTHASITAKPFFLGRGYEVVREQKVFRKGIALTNYVMVKSYLFAAENLFSEQDQRPII